jgi:hypothetical protein
MKISNTNSLIQQVNRITPRLQVDPITPTANVGDEADRRSSEKFIKRQKSKKKTQLRKLQRSRKRQY